jgi:L-ascorbate metabolism protein UlaG (beta-lactamase superfamily)
MERHGLTITYIGGPTALLEFGGLRFLSDPTFDPAGGQYPSGAATLRKVSAPAISAGELGPIDCVLLSHDQHFDNLDRAGREVLVKATQVLTTEEGTQRLGGNSVGLRNWQSMDVRGPSGIVRVTATPARHGPEGLSRGAVIGFVLQHSAAPEAIYISGDTVWYEAVREVAQRFNVKIAILHLGAARVPEVGPFHLTMTAEEGVEAARSFPDASIVPIHFEGWEHFSEGRDTIAQAFEAAGLTDRLCWPLPGEGISLEL